MQGQPCQPRHAEYHGSTRAGARLTGRLEAIADKPGVVFYRRILVVPIVRQQLHALRVLDGVVAVCLQHDHVEGHRREVNCLRPV